jgi:GNAT superfamily N-acetyltransferase
MTFAMRHRDDPFPALAEVSGVEVHQVWDVPFMARLQGRPDADIEQRFTDGHRAYVAWVDEEPAAWGWVATRVASIGELGATFSIGKGDRYLWNFVTLPSHRGRGIYPRLLQGILRAESREAERFAIAYAPENRASASGIAKAGFLALAEMSFDRRGRPALRSLVPGGGAVAAHVLGLRETDEPLTPCWRCVRSGRGVMFCPAGSCACDYQRPHSGCAA